MQTWLPLLTGVAVSVATLAAAVASAEDRVRIAQAEASTAGEEDLGAVEAETDSAAGADAQERPAEATPVRPGIEEIVIRGESETVKDFERADSVTGFDASDLEALGAQSIADLDQFTPNLEIVTSGATTPTFFIRGVGLNDFNPNSTGAVALYHDDVPINAPALQLGTLFDLEGVNILRGPQGSGAARNASAGAIKLYSRKPSGEFGGYLRSSFGNYGYRDFEGAIEAPVYEDILATRLAFRWAERDGYAKNDCGGLPPFEERPNRNDFPGLSSATDPRWSLCGETVRRTYPEALKEEFGWLDGRSRVPAGLPSSVNDLGNWAARGQLLFEPTLDMTWLVNAHGSRRDAQSQLGQAYGTQESVLLPDGSRQVGLLGGRDNGSYQAADVQAMLERTEAELIDSGLSPPAAANLAKISVAEELADNLDEKPWRADYDRVGPTKNDSWGGSLRGDIVLPGEINVTTITGYDTYDRLIDIDLDFSPNVLFEIRTDDEGWQVTQGLEFSGQVGDEAPLRWEAGGFYLQERLDVAVDNNFGDAQIFGVAARDYTQKLWSYGIYAGLERDFWGDFTLDGGFRFNWERRKIDYELERNTQVLAEKEKDTWSAPTGFIRLTYRFREDTHAYWKYTRGWKSGTFNATSSLFKGITPADPETIDSFEVGLRGSWFEGRLGLDLSLFYYAYDQYQIFTTENDFGSLPEFVIINANDAEVYGSEVTLVARPWLGAFYNVRFGWLESQFLDFTQTQLRQQLVGGESDVFAIEINNTGNRLLNSPQFKLSITAEQMVPLGRWGSLTARYDGAWTDDTFFDATEGRGIPNALGQLILPENTIGQPAFWLHNLWLGYRPPDGSIEVAGWIRNLADEAYKTFGFDASTFNRTTIYFVGEPRTYGMTLSVHF